MLEEAATAAALVEQHYMPALKAHGWAANGCIVAAVDLAATLAICLAAQLMQLYPAHPPTLAPNPNTLNPNTSTVGLDPRALGADPLASGAPTVEVVVLVQSSRLQGLVEMAQQPWFRVKNVFRRACPDADMRAFAAQGIQLGMRSNPSSQMVSSYLAS